MNADLYLIKKAVDKSTLYQGVSIPVAFQKLFYEKVGITLSRGESTQIKILMDGKEYPVKLTNQSFDENKYPTRSDILQIRYDSNSELLGVLRSKFSRTWEALTSHYNKYGSSKGFSTTADDEEYLILYATPARETLSAECVSNKEYEQERASISQMDEFLFESMSDEHCRHI